MIDSKKEIKRREIGERDKGTKRGDVCVCERERGGNKEEREREIKKRV